MKIIRTLFAVILLSAFQVSSFGRTVLPGPKIKDLVGSWVGFDEYATSFYRLTLTTNECRLATTFLKQPIRIYNPTNWTLTKGKIRFNSISPDNIAATVDGSAEWNRLVLNLKITQWTGTITFYREEQFAERLAQIRDQMQQPSK